MAVFGGFMTIVSILGFFLTVIWFVLPFVIFSIKGRVDRSVELLEDIDRRLALLEARTRTLEPVVEEPVVPPAFEDTLPE
ncbi:hypothetical protein LPW11_13100 [Geomonas sp. RF6]|uniref:hypothetical protein n=1 Tax=Geomonas sp. RF6 TaxID=2897342 RepID=UPI001E2F85E5|nr:hypothetical protein [Geomonas sp. RF6]UFS68835.1 hypothetical protein LPW11_13100 [Geomonas sp. RF6]